MKTTETQNEEIKKKKKKNKLNRSWQKIDREKIREISKQK